MTEEVEPRQDGDKHAKGQPEAIKFRVPAGEARSVDPVAPTSISGDSDTRSTNFHQGDFCIE